MTTFLKIKIKDNTSWLKFIEKERKLHDNNHGNMERYKDELTELARKHNGRLILHSINNLLPNDIDKDWLVPFQWVHGIDFDKEEDKLIFKLIFDL